MTAGGSKGRYLQEEYEKALEQDLRELTESGLGTPAASEERKAVNQQQHNQKSLRSRDNSSVFPESLREDPVAYWAWQLERDLLSLHQDNLNTTKARNDLIRLFQQMQVLDIKNFEEQKFKILAVMKELIKNVEKPLEQKKESGSEMVSHLDNLIESVSAKLQVVKDRRDILKELKDQCKLLHMNPLGLALLRNVQDTAAVILGHLSEQCDYLSKDEKGEIHKFIKAILDRVEKIHKENSSGMDLAEKIIRLDEHLKEEPHLAAKSSLNELYHKTRKNVASRLRKALNSSHFEKQHKEVDGQIEECLRVTACEFSVMNNKFYNKKSSLITKLSVSEFKSFCKDFSRDWSRWGRPLKKAQSEVQLRPVDGAKVPKLHAFNSQAGSRTKRSFIFPLNPEHQLPPVKSGGWVGKEEIKYRKK